MLNDTGRLALSCDIGSDVDNCVVVNILNVLFSEIPAE